MSIDIAEAKRIVSAHEDCRALRQQIESLRYDLRELNKAAAEKPTWIAVYHLPKTTGYYQTREVRIELPISIAQQALIDAIVRIERHIIKLGEMP
jgi:hypothetical protein